MCFQLKKFKIPFQRELYALYKLKLKALEHALMCFQFEKYKIWAESELYIWYKLKTSYFQWALSIEASSIIYSRRFGRVNYVFPFNPIHWLTFPANAIATRVKWLRLRLSFILLPFSHNLSLGGNQMLQVLLQSKRITRSVCANLFYFFN